MTDATRSRQVEYYNPRPLILGTCFFWCVVMGFCIFFFSPPIKIEAAPPYQPAAEPVQPAPAGRPDGVQPNIEEVPQIPAIANKKLTFEEMQIDPPPYLLTTEGDLNSKTAVPPPAGGQRQPAATPARPPGRITEPPIPELNPY